MISTRILIALYWAICFLIYPTHRTSAQEQALGASSGETPKALVNPGFGPERQRLLAARLARRQVGFF
jgi:hypothetical protein